MSGRGRVWSTHCDSENMPSRPGWADTKIKKPWYSCVLQVVGVTYKQKGKRMFAPLNSTLALGKLGFISVKIVDAVQLKACGGRLLQLCSLTRWKCFLFLIKSKSSLQKQKHPRREELQNNYTASVFSQRNIQKKWMVLVTYWSLWNTKIRRETEGKLSVTVG